jgi:predicted ribosome quality control (RQC) complex YloA/Tae2 family protein
MLQLRRWLEVRFGLDPEDKGDIMRHGKQMDTFNCGLTTANTIGHYLFKKPLWTPDRAVLERVKWYLRIFRAMSPTENPICTPTDTHMMDIYPSAEKPLSAEDPNVDIEISSTKDDVADHIHTFSDLLKDFCKRTNILEDGDDLSGKLTRQWTKARWEVQHVVNQRLEAESELSDFRRKIEELEKERDEALHKARQLEEILQENQGLGVESELSKLRREVETLAGERDQALNESKRLRDLLQEQKAQGGKQFGWSPPPEALQDRGHNGHRHSSLGAQPNSQGENPRSVTLLKEALATRTRLFEKEKNRREELESEVVVLRSELGEFSFLSGGLVFLQCAQGRLIYPLTCCRNMKRSHEKSV